MNFTDALIRNGRVVSLEGVSVNDGAPRLAEYRIFLEQLPAPCEIELVDIPLRLKLHEVAPGAAVLIARFQTMPVFTVLIVSGQAATADEEAAVSQLQTLTIRIGRLMGQPVGADLRMLQERPLIGRIQLPTAPQSDGIPLERCNTEIRCLCAAYFQRNAGRQPIGKGQPANGT